MTNEFIMNHLWQSSCVVLFAALLALMLRKNSPRIRYWVWLSASLKFLVPFALLVSLGNLVRRPVPHSVSFVPAPVFPDAMVQIAEPFSPFPGARLSTPVQRNWAPLALGVLWFLGFLAIAFARCLSWLRMQTRLQAGTPAEFPVPVPTVVTPGAEEPGVVGFLQPVLVLPAQLLVHLNPEQLGAILAHELCHVRRRDNLFAVLHMVVEALFWFNPLVWWVGSRMVEERELACDEEVLRMGCEPADYVEAILKVCRLQTESPVACVSGVAGADIKKRLHSILAGSIACELSTVKKVALATISLAAIAAPILVGVLNVPVQGQILHATEPLPSFEVASVKPWKRPPAPPPPPPGEVDERPPRVDPSTRPPAAFTDRVHMIVPPVLLVSSAFNLPADGNARILNRPDWLRQDDEQYEISAKIGAAEFAAMQKMTPRQRDERIALMLQALLADRFKLKVHFESREMTVYALTAAKGGPKLTLAKGNETSNLSLGGRRLTATAVSLDQLAHSPFITGATGGRPVVNQTGLQGVYDFTLTWGSNGLSPEDPRNPDKPDFFTAVQEQLGLRLASSKAPVEVIVIDHIEKPSAN